MKGLIKYRASVRLQQGIAHHSVHHVQQTGRGVAQIFQKIAASRLLLFPRQQFRHAQHAGQGSAHVMGHVGKEGALEAVGGFGLFPFAVELPCRAADAQRADKADKPESSAGVLLARFSCQTQRSGVKRQADASQQIALGRILMALQTAFFRVKSSQSAELGGFGTYQFKTLSVLVVKTFQRGFLPCVGPVARRLGCSPAMRNPAMVDLKFSEISRTM